MFYCEKCRKKSDLPISMSRSYGKCEICGAVGKCYDVPSSTLPERSKKRKIKVEKTTKTKKTKVRK